jgi:GntR family transcriptional regulator
MPGENMKIAKNTPLKIQVAEKLGEMIRAEYFNGEQIPNENELAEIMGVSRGTISQALAILSSEGLISRRQGVGTFANPNILQLNVRADLPFQLAELIKNAGYSPSVELIHYEIKPADEEMASLLKIPVDAPTLVLERVYLADNEPAIYLIDRISAGLIRNAYESKDLKKFLFHFLRDHCDVYLSYTLSNLIPCIASKEIADMLKINEGTAVLHCEDTHYDMENRPVMHSTLYYSDEKLRFTVMRSFL